jgi:hypothetical protein
MDAIITVFVFMVIRLVIPIGLMLTLGSLLTQRQSSH